MKNLLIVLAFAWVIPNLDWKIYLDMFPSAREMAFCESGNKRNLMGNPKAINPKDPTTRSVGLLQFKDKTFYGWAKLAELDDPDIWNPIHQIIIFRWAEENNLLNHWGCLKKVKQGDLAFLFDV